MTDSYRDNASVFRAELTEVPIHRGMFRRYVARWHAPRDQEDVR